MLSSAATKDPAMSGQLKYERVEGDFYPTPPENVDCLLHFVDMRNDVVWEPACGKGHISKRLIHNVRGVYSTDLFERGYGVGGIDFLTATNSPGKEGSLTTAIVTNPPFDDMAEKFIRQSLDLMSPIGGKVAMFLRNEYDMAMSRHDLFEGHPAYLMKICVTKRPRWIEGSKGSPRHNYAWYVWDWSNMRVPGHGAEIRYIHPKNAVPFGKKEILH